MLLALMLTGCAEEQPVAVPPTGLQAVVTAEGTIFLSWNPATDAGGYRVYRRESGDPDFKFISDTPEARYSDILPDMGSTYDYKVTALGPEGETEGTVCRDVAMGAGGALGEILADPVITSVTRLDAGTNVIFFSLENQDCEYEILRQDGSGTWTSLGKTTDHIFYDTTAVKGDTYHYQVRATNPAGRTVQSLVTAQNTNPKDVFGVPVMMYHEFVTPEDLENGVAFDEYAIYYEAFERDLKWLRKNGYTTITTRELAQYLQGEGEMPKKPVIITIDDGKLGVYKNAYPLLQKYNMKAVLSVIGEEIDAATQAPELRENHPAPYCTWEELAEMAASGHVEIASHTYGLHVYSHNGRIGANCSETDNMADFRRDALEDYRLIQEKLQAAGIPEAVTMAYPYSERSPEADAAWMDCGYMFLLGGNSASVRTARTNYFIPEAGINPHSALLRRVARMHGTPIRDYIG